ncbi:rab-GTPase-TBC domain-containing protein [Lentinula detonsa]|uniref:Rab-GTPase-TBC domain-containing protein n=2 Tax=Lentinula TaxID=5352 RepID=A0A9W8U099_9AGAR|nr:rab-GTPase-TBC domain-containing protein [Lentinula detonsa]KAJ3790223.1 rab-GTPase-TBC domain-containing protein [Lentinula aff. detonsa]KAJ3794440.1 rab-GTPase-TBC domain-containing protein [Lentinula aff. detonsa]KAJ3988395.1 rab-GTPase-TBC domain-containing protein [Lentinula detonsa]
MDFELVRPNFPSSAGRSSEDSTSPGLVRRSESGAGEGIHLRTQSPALSISSGISGTSRITTGVSSDSAAFRSKASSKASTSEASMDAHRQREQKWMSLISTVPAEQARKNKKVRKLLGEGVPASVRYLVWSLITNAKSKGVAGVYNQLSKRVRVAAFADMERDVKRCFGEHPLLQSTEGPLLNLLQAYLTMVPDVQYSTGLTLIAGHTLLLAPEEDAFWIFVSMMSSALRPYFSSNSTQMEVDAALFSRALEANDVQVSKKVLVDMGINPAHMCFPWFTTLFVGSLPGEYVNRVWDLFLFEGVPILIRVGLAILYCCRRAILEATSEDAVLYYLKRPQPTWLPPTPDAFMTLAFSFKVKDDDVRKQRIKMEKQVKKQAQSQGIRLVANGSGISLPRDV